MNPLRTALRRATRHTRRTWLLAPGTWYLAPGTWHLAPGTWHVALAVFVATANPAHSQSTGGGEIGPASTILDATSVSARLYNNGDLFLKSARPDYDVPRSTPANGIFARRLWIGGLIEDDLHVSVATCGLWKRRPGP